MLTTVAAARTCDPLALLDEPLWRVLWHFHQLEDREQRQALRDRRARVDAGVLVAMAFNHPDSLDDELRRVRNAIDAYEYGPDSAADGIAALRAAGDALASRIEAGRALAPEALVS